VSEQAWADEMKDVIRRAEVAAGLIAELRLNPAPDRYREIMRGRVLLRFQVVAAAAYATAIDDLSREGFEHLAQGKVDALTLTEGLRDAVLEGDRLLKLLGAEHMGPAAAIKIDDVLAKIEKEFQG
jgi:hypothetical protein